MLFDKIIIKKMRELNELKGMLFYRGGEYREDIINEIKYIVGDLEVLLEEQREEFRARTKEFTLEELSMYDGRNNRPAYVAINGSVYDVTGVQGFMNGQHFGVKAGTDATDSFRRCHDNKREMLGDLRIVGVLRQ